MFHTPCDTNLFSRRTTAHFVFSPVPHGQGFS